MNNGAPIIYPNEPRGQKASANSIPVVLPSDQVTSSDGAIVDGVSSLIRATVLDLINSNPLTAAIVDASGNQITSFGSSSVAVTSVVPGTGQTNLGKAEDLASADGDVGVGALAVRKATPANTSGADGDYEFLQISAGRLWASVVVDTALPAGAALIGKVGLDQTTPGTTNAISLAQIGSTTVATGNGVVGAGVQRVAIASDNTAFNVTADTELPAAATIAADAVTPTVPGIAAYHFIKTGGANTWDRQYPVANAANTTGTGIAAAGLMAQFDDTSPQTVTENQFGNVRMSANGILYVAGSIAHNVANVAGNQPVTVAFEAVAHGANPTEVAAGAVTKWYSNRDGIPFVIAGHMNPIIFKANYTSAQTNVALVTVSSGTKIIITKATVTISNACSVNPSATIGMGASTTPTAAHVVLSHPGIAPGSGMIEGNGGSILDIGADGDDARITLSVPTGGSADVYIEYYTASS